MIHQAFYPIEIRGDRMSLFEIKDVSFQYDTKPVLKDVNMEFEPGKLYAIIGPSGTGKTTLLSLSLIGTARILSVNQPIL